jgi:hypothetical protein
VIARRFHSLKDRCHRKSVKGVASAGIVGRAVIDNDDFGIERRGLGERGGDGIQTRGYGGGAVPGGDDDGKLHHPHR